MDRCKNNPENSSTTKVGEHVPCGYSMSTIWAFDGIWNKHVVNRGKDCIKKFYKSLREHKMKIMNFQRKKMILITNSMNHTLIKQTVNHVKKIEDK